MGPRLALGLCAALAVLHTWPLASHPAFLSLNHNADAQLNAWTVAWIAHALVHQPLRLFDANIFAPERLTLAYSEPMLTPALAGAPLWWLGASPVLVYNVLVLAGLTLTAWLAWRVTTRWTGSSTAGLVAAALAAFNVHQLTRLPHLVAAHAWGPALLLLLVDRLMTDRSSKTAVMLVLAIAAIGANSLHGLMMSGLAAGVVVLTSRWSWPAASRLLVAGLAGAVLLIPVLWPYWELSKQGLIRGLEAAQPYSATWGSYLASTSHLHAGWSAPFFRDETSVLFAGVTALGLAFVGVVSGLAVATTRRYAMALILLATGGVFLSFGPTTAVYRWLYDWLVPLRSIRVPIRFAYLYLLSVAVLAGFGTAWIERRFSRRSVAVAVTMLLTLGVTVEAWHGPISTTPFRGIPGLYGYIARLPEPVTLVEVPFYPRVRVSENAEYILNSTSHFRPLMNGYSGFVPTSYRERVGLFARFPDPAAIQAMRDQGATHVMVHLEHYGRYTEAVTEALVGASGLRLIGSDARGHRLYEIRPVR